MGLKWIDLKGFLGSQAIVDLLVRLTLRPIKCKYLDRGEWGGWLFGDKGEMGSLGKNVAKSYLGKDVWGKIAKRGGGR